MASETRPFRSAAMPSLLALVLLLIGVLPALAQDLDINADTPDTTQTGDVAVQESVKHPAKLAVSGAACYWAPMHIIKEDVYDINDLTDGGFGADFGLRWYALDGLAVSVHGLFGGIGFTDTKPGQMEEISSRLDNGLTPDAYLEMSGFSIGMQAYVGTQLMPKSKFNPYFKGNILYMDWSLLEEKGGDTLVFDREPFEASNMGIGFGMGTEYELGRTIDLEFEWMWNYLLTEDEDKWDEESSWTNTHYWNLSIGLIWSL